MYIGSSSRTNEHIVITTDTGKDSLMLVNTVLNTFVQALACTVSKQPCGAVELVRNLVAHGDARAGKWRESWRMEWVASTLTPPPNVVYPALLKLMRAPRLPAVDWTDAPTDLNGLVRFGERRNLVFSRVPSRSARAILLHTHTHTHTHIYIYVYIYLLIYLYSALTTK